MAPARLLTHARILLKANQGEGGSVWTDTAIAGALEVHPATIARVRRAYVEDGLAAALERKAPNRAYPRALDGTAEARLVALACGEPPDGRQRWTLRLLAEELVRHEVVDAVSHQTVRRSLQRTASSRGRGSNGAPRPRPTASPSGAWGTSWASIAARTIAAGRSSARTRRAGDCSAPGAPRCRPRRGAPRATVRSTSGAGWPTCSSASLDGAFPPAEAKLLAERLEVHHTPKHGGRPSTAETEPSALRRRRLRRRLGDRAATEREVAAWAVTRNAATAAIGWRFTAREARTKRKRLDPAAHA